MSDQPDWLAGSFQGGPVRVETLHMGPRSLVVRSPNDDAPIEIELRLPVYAMGDEVVGTATRGITIERENAPWLVHAVQSVGRVPAFVEDLRLPRIRAVWRAYEAAREESGASSDAMRRALGELADGLRDVLGTYHCDGSGRLANGAACSGCRGCKP